jgi:hypothetical protein
VGGGGGGGLHERNCSNVPITSMNTYSGSYIDRIQGAKRARHDGGLIRSAHSLRAAAIGIRSSRRAPS